MSRVGEGDVAIFPTFGGFRSAVTREVDSTGKESGHRFSSAFKGAVSGIAGVFAALKLRDFFVSGVQGAAELEQSVGAVEAVFKKNAGQINKWAGSAATDVGLTKDEFNELGTLIGSQLKNGGTAMDQLAPKTRNLITLGADLSSMFGGTTSDAVEALSSALKGERDPIERYGVTLNQAKIDAEAAALGFKKVGGTLSAEANQAATLSLIMKQTADAHGNFASEADTVSHKQQVLNALWQQGKTRIMSAFLPAVGAITGFLAEKLPGAINVAEGVVKSLTKAGAELWKGLTAPPGVSASAGGLVGFGTVVRDVFAKIRDVVDPFFAALKQAFSTGDFGAFGDAFSGLVAVARPAGPILLAVGKAIGDLSGSIGQVVAGALPLLNPLLQGAANVMQFLAEHTGILTAAIVALAAGFLVFKAAQVVSNVASAGSVIVTGALALSNFRLAAAIRASGTASMTSAVATGTNTAALNVNAAASTRTRIAAVAHRVALIAGSAAAKVAAGAQWALNAAMSANPIALVVIAIAALVAGLIWFFTQTKIGQQIWAGFMAFLQQAWANITLIFQTAIAGISAGWSAFWSWISGVARTIFAAVVAFITAYINTARAVISAVLGAIAAGWNATWRAISAVVQAIFGAIVSTISTYIQLARAVIVAVLSAIAGTWRAVWNGVVGVARSVWAGIQSVISGAINIVRTIIATAMAVIKAIFTGDWAAIGGIISGAAAKIRGIVGGMVEGVKNAIGGIGRAIMGVKDAVFNAVAGAGRWLVDSGRAIIQGFIDGISGMIGSVGDAIGGVMDFVGSFFPHSPAKRGYFSGSGWSGVKDAGAAVNEQFQEGLNDSPPSLTARLRTLVDSGGYVTPASAAAGSGASAAAAAGEQVFHLYDKDGTLMATFRGLLSEVLRPLGAGEVRASMGVG